MSVRPHTRVAVQSEPACPGDPVKVPNFSVFGRSVGNSNASVARRYDWPTVYVLDRVLQPVGARCHIRRIDRQQHGAETYHLVWNKFSAKGCSVLAHLPLFFTIAREKALSLKFLRCEHNPVHVPTAITALSCCFTHLREQTRRLGSRRFGRAQERRWSDWHLVGFLQVCEKFKRLEIKKMEF
jgi:hypothetical protein